MSLIGAALIGGAASLIGSGLSYMGQKQTNDANKRMQYDFAQNSLKWKVNDAREAGLHPLAALGAQGYSPTAQMVNPLDSAGDLGRDIGQNIDRARMASRTLAENQLSEAMRAKSIAETDVALAQADQLRANTALMIQSGTYPGMPVLSTNRSHGGLFGLWNHGEGDTYLPGQSPRHGNRETVPAEQLQSKRRAIGTLLGADVRPTNLPRYIRGRR